MPNPLLTKIDRCFAYLLYAQDILIDQICPPKTHEEIAQLAQVVAHALNCVVQELSSDTPLLPITHNTDLSRDLPGATASALQGGNEVIADETALHAEIERLVAVAILRNAGTAPQ